MCRFILGWKMLGYAQRFCAEIVNYADDFCVLGKTSAATMLAAVKRVMDELKLPINEQKTRCWRCPDEAIEFLGYRIGHNHRRNGNWSTIKTSVGKFVHTPDELLWDDCGLIRLAPTIKSLPWAKA